MPIVMQQHQQDTGPIIVCDVCSEPIAGVGEAWVLWVDPNGVEPARVTDYMFAHKRDCVERVDRSTRALLSSMEVGTFLSLLQRNVVAGRLAGEGIPESDG